MRDRQDCQYKEGDYVLIKRAEGRNTKLNKLRKGPFTIVRIQNRNVIVQDLVANLEQSPVDISSYVLYSTVINPEVVAVKERICS